MFTNSCVSSFGLSIACIQLNACRTAMGTRQHNAQHAANLCSGCSCANVTDVALVFHLVK